MCFIIRAMPDSTCLEALACLDNYCPPASALLSPVVPEPWLRVREISQGLE